MAKGKCTNIHFVCKQCKSMKKHSASTFKAVSASGQQRKISDLKFKKFCGKCRAHTDHGAKETKKGN